MSERPDDEDLVRPAQAGDESALTVLMQRYQALLTRHAERQLPGFLRPRVSIADVVQEAQIVVHERMGRSREATKKLYGRALSRFTEEFQRRGGMTHG